MSRFVAKVALAVLAAAVAVALGLERIGALDLGTQLLVVLVVAAAVLAAATTIASAYAEWRDLRTAARRDEADVLLTATLWAVVDAVAADHPLDYRELGLAAYQLRRRWWAPWRLRLGRLHRVRARRRPAASGVDWAPGKGVVGLCVERGAVVAQDVGADYEALGEVGEADWPDVSEDVRAGLSFAEFSDLRGKYDVVVATPVIDEESGGSRVVGCVALDGPAGSLERLTATDVLGVLDSAARGVLRLAVR